MSLRSAQDLFQLADLNRQANIDKVVDKAVGYLSLEFSLESQLQVVEGEGSAGYFVAGRHRALASREKGRVGTGGPEPSQHGDCL